jgi:hypothetical protein
MGKHSEHYGHGLRDRLAEDVAVEGVKGCGSSTLGNASRIARTWTRKQVADWQGSVSALSRLAHLPMSQDQRSRSLKLIAKHTLTQREIEKACKLWSGDWFDFDLDEVRSSEHVPAAKRAWEQEQSVPRITGGEPVTTKGGCVYFIQCQTANRIKIGWTRGAVTKRCRHLQTGCPTELKPLFGLVAHRSMEKVLHGCFAASHVRGEWYACDGLLASFVHWVQSVPADQICSTDALAWLGEP